MRQETNYVRKNCVVNRLIYVVCALLDGFVSLIYLVSKCRKDRGSYYVKNMNCFGQSFDTSGYCGEAVLKDAYAKLFLLAHQFGCPNTGGWIVDARRKGCYHCKRYSQIYL